MVSQGSRAAARLLQLSTYLLAFYSSSSTFIAYHDKHHTFDLLTEPLLLEFITPVHYMPVLILTCDRLPARISLTGVHYMPQLISTLIRRH